MTIFYPKLNFDKNIYSQILKIIFIKKSPSLHNSNFNKYFILKILKKKYFHQIIKFP